MVDVLGKVPSKLSVEKLECWIWGKVSTLNGISMLSLTLCMVIDVIFPAGGRRCHQNGWAGMLVSNLFAALGVARLRVASSSAHPSRWACRFSECCLQVVAKSFRSIVSLRVAHQGGLSCEISNGWLWCMDCLSVGGALWCVCCQSKHGQEENV